MIYVALFWALRAFCTEPFLHLNHCHSGSGKQCVQLQLRWVRLTEACNDVHTQTPSGAYKQYT